MIMNLYVVVFNTKKGGNRNWVIHLEAPTIQEATRKAKHLWESDPTLNPMYITHVVTRRLRDNEEFLYHYFKPCKVEE